jgi:hypothetical protein
MSLAVVLTKPDEISKSLAIKHDLAEFMRATFCNGAHGIESVLGTAN